MPSTCVIGKPAPAFKGQAVLPGGEIKEISIEDFKGEWLLAAVIGSDQEYARHPKSPHPRLLSLVPPRRQVPGFLLLPSW